MEPFHSQPIDMKALSLQYCLNGHVIHTSVRLTTVTGKIIWFMIFCVEC